MDEAEAVCRTAVKVEVELIGQVPAARTRSQLYNLACFYSRASAAVQADPQKAEEHAAQAVALLRKAHTAAGWDNVANANKDHDLDPIRNREDFRQLLQELEEKDKQVGRRDGPVGPKNKEGRCVSPPSRTRTGPAAPERLVVRAQGVKEPMLPAFPCLRQRKKS